MSEPNADPQNPAPDRAPGSAGPEYGGYSRPEFGAMSSQYPSDYDPYVYGRPEPERKDDAKPDASGNVFGPRPGQGDGRQAPANGDPYARGEGRQPYGNPYEQPNQYGQNGSYGQGAYGQDPYGQDPYGQGPQAQGPYMRNGSGGRPSAGNRGNVDLNDPNQNPLYGHWDVYAILAFVFSFFAIPVLPALMGGLAMWRTRTFHMKGYGLALAAVIINVLYTIASLWLFMNGMSTMDLYQQMLGGTGGSVDDGSLSA